MSRFMWNLIETNWKILNPHRGVHEYDSAQKGIRENCPRARNDTNLHRKFTSVQTVPPRLVRSVPPQRLTTVRLPGDPGKNSCDSCESHSNNGALAMAMRLSTGPLNSVNDAEVVKGLSHPACAAPKCDRKLKRGRSLRLKRMMSGQTHPTTVDPICSGSVTDGRASLLIQSVRLRDRDPFIPNSQEVTRHGG
jgi:hypothetical protein